MKRNLAKSMVMMPLFCLAITGCKNEKAYCFEDFIGIGGELVSLSIGKTKTVTYKPTELGLTSEFRVVSNYMENKNPGFEGDAYVSIDKDKNCWYATGREPGHGIVRFEVENKHGIFTKTVEIDVSDQMSGYYLDDNEQKLENYVAQFGFALDHKLDEAVTQRFALKLDEVDGKYLYFRNSGVPVGTYANMLQTKVPFNLSNELANFISNENGYGNIATMQAVTAGDYRTNIDEFSLKAINTSETTTEPLEADKANYSKIKMVFKISNGDSLFNKYSVYLSNISTLSNQYDKLALRSYFKGNNSYLVNPFKTSDGYNVVQGTENKIEYRSLSSMTKGTDYLTKPAENEFYSYLDITTYYEYWERSVTIRDSHDIGIQLTFGFSGYQA